MRVTDEGSPGTRYQGEISIKTGQREGAVLVKTPWFTLLLGTLNCILTSAGLQHLRRYVWTQVEKIIPLNGVFLSITIFETQPVFYHATVSVWSVGRWGPIRTVFFRRQRHILLHQSLLHLRRRKRTWAWINTYITLCRMNIHLPPILGFWLYQDFDSHVRSWSCFKASIMGPNFKWFLESCRRWNQVCSIYGFPRFPRNLCVISGGIWCQGLGLSFCGCFWHQIRMIQRRGCAQDL